MTPTATGYEFIVQPTIYLNDVKVVHRIDIPLSYQREGFWSAPLVLHEMDHVRISTDPIWVKRFRDQVRNIGLIKRSLAPGEVRSNQSSMARDVVDVEIKKIFDETIALMNIRYQELDRVTEHGIKPLVATFWEQDPLQAPASP